MLNHICSSSLLCIHLLLSWHQEMDLLLCAAFVLNHGVKWSLRITVEWEIAAEVMKFSSRVKLELKQWIAVLQATAKLGIDNLPCSGWHEINCLVSSFHLNSAIYIPIWRMIKSQGKREAYSSFGVSSFLNFHSRKSVVLVYCPFFWWGDWVEYRDIH